MSRTHDPADISFAVGMLLAIILGAIIIAWVGSAVDRSSGDGKEPVEVMVTEDK